VESSAKAERARAESLIVLKRGFSSSVRLPMPPLSPTIASITTPKLSIDRLDPDLLTRVVEFKKVFFPASWAHYDTAQPGTLKIVPWQLPFAITFAFGL